MLSVQDSVAYEGSDNNAEATITSDSNLLSSGELSRRKRVHVLVDDDKNKIQRLSHIQFSLCLNLVASQDITPAACYPSYSFSVYFTLSLI